MKLTGNEDLRVQKTIEAIRVAFEGLMLEKGFGKITVKELCERARINKKTFYRYYPAIEYLLAEMQSEYAEEYLERTRNLVLPRDVAPITEAFFRFSEEKGPFYEAITSEARFDGVRSPMVERVMGECAVDTGRGRIEDDYVVTFITSTTMGVYRRWISAGKDLPVDEVIALVTDLLTSGIKGRGAPRAARRA